MSYLKTVLTYHQPSEAEVDKAFLEANGITVCLLNANTSRNELGAPFYIQLQVADDDYLPAVELLKAHNPQRFGSAERVAELDREIKRSALWFVVAALPSALIAYWAVPAPMRSEIDRAAERVMGPPPDYRLHAALIVGCAAGILAVVLRGKRAKRRMGA